MFCPTASSLFDCAGFLSSWLADLAAEQRADGNVPLVVPDVLPDGPPIAVWGDAAVHRALGALRTFRRCRHPRDAVGQHAQLGGLVASCAGDDLLWSGQFQLGDWLDPTRHPRTPPLPKRTRMWSPRHTSHVRRRSCLARATVLGDTSSAEHYGALAARVRQAFAENYVTPAGRVLSDAQTVYALAIAWSLLPTERQRAGAGRRLADLVRLSGYRISTGFVGTPLILDALSQSGYTDVAYRLLFQHDVPSWLYAVYDGSNDGLGALGQHAPRRVHQSWRDDVLQPLRAWFRGGLPPPSGRGAGALRARVPIDHS